MKLALENGFRASLRNGALAAMALKHTQHAKLIAIEKFLDQKNLAQLEYQAKDDMRGYKN